MGLPAFAAFAIFNLRLKFNHRKKDTEGKEESSSLITHHSSLNFLFGFLAGFSGVFFGTVILALLLVSAGSNFFGVAKFAALAHLPVMIIEGIITGFIVTFLKKVKPEILEGNKRGI